MPSELLERRPDVIAAERRVAAAFYRVGEAKAARLPRISLTGGVNAISSDLFVLQDRDNPVWSAGADLLMPLFRGGALKTQVEIRTAAQKQSVAEYASIGLRAFGDVEDALATGLAMRDRERILSAQLMDSQRAFDLARARYDVGVGDLRAVEQRQIALHANRSALLRVQAEQRVQRVNLHLALGGSFMLPPSPASHHPITTDASAVMQIRWERRCQGRTFRTGQERQEEGERKVYEKQLRQLQAELCHLQRWVKHKGLRVIVLFEGRDGAGKGGTIRAITERVNPRVFRVVALPAPSDREKTQVYLQRYIPHFPAAGEVVIFDRSWYNRPGVEYVMGFCSNEQHKTFLENCPTFERYTTDGGVILLKYWLEVSNDEQARRFEARIKDPLRQWKLSPMDLPSREKWYQYSKARDLMLKATDTRHAPWFILRSDDKKSARLNCITHLLKQIPYKRLPAPKIKLAKRSKKHAYDDQAAIARRRFVPERY